MRLAVLLSLGSSQEHDGGSLCTQARPWKWGRSSLQPISAVLEIYCPAKSETWPHATGPKSALSSANPRSRARGGTWHRNVRKDTDFLVIGESPGATKLGTAAERR